VSNIKNLPFFKIISLFLIIAFITFDISWAYPTNAPQAGYKLSGESSFQANIMEVKRREFQESLFSDVKLLLTVNSIAKFLLEDKLPADHLAYVLNQELGEIKEGIDLDHVISAENNTILLTYTTAGTKYIIQVAKKEDISPKELVGYQWIVNDRYVIRVCPEGHPEPVKRPETQKESEVKISEPVAEFEEEIKTESTSETPPSKIKLIVKAVITSLILILVTPLSALAQATGVSEEEQLRIFTYILSGFMFVAMAGFIIWENRENIKELLFPVRYNLNKLQSAPGASTRAYHAKKLLKKKHAKALEKKVGKNYREILSAYIFVETGNLERLVKLGDRSIPALESAVMLADTEGYSGDRELALDSIRALARIGSGAAIDTIDRAFTSKLEFSSIYNQAILAVCEVGNPPTYQLLLKALKKDALRPGTRSKVWAKLKEFQLNPSLSQTTIPQDIKSALKTGKTAMIRSLIDEKIRSEHEKIRQKYHPVALSTFEPLTYIDLDSTETQRLVGELFYEISTFGDLEKAVKVLDQVLSVETKDLGSFRVKKDIGHHGWVLVRSAGEDRYTSWDDEWDTQFIIDVPAGTVIEKKECRVICDFKKLKQALQKAAPKPRNLSPAETPNREGELFGLIESTVNNDRARLVDQANGVIDFVNEREEIKRLLIINTSTTAEIEDQAERALARLKEFKEADSELEVPENISSNAEAVKNGLDGLEAEGLVSSVILLARKAQREGQKLIIGLETDWIPGFEKGKLQHNALNPLVNEIKALQEKLKDLGLNNVMMVHRSGDALANELLTQAEETSTKLSNVVVLASSETINSETFSELRSTETEQRAFLAGVDAAQLAEFYSKNKEDFEKQLLVRLTQLLCLSLELAAGKRAPDLPIIKEYNEALRIVIFLPEAKAINYQDLQEINKLKKLALQAA
jgi:hypothetical protein